MCRKSFGMQLPREILDGGNDSRRGSVDRIADDSEAAVADSIKTAPSGTLCEHVEIIMSAIGMRRRENEKVRLQADHFLKTHVGQSCAESTMEVAPASRNASAIKVPLPTEISGSDQTMK